MEKPRDDTTHQDLLDHGSPTSAAIGADLETQGLEKPFKAANAGLKAGIRALEDKDEEVLEKGAIFAVRDRSLDRDINEFEARLLVLVDKKRDAPLYRRHFKNGLREITQAEPRVAEPALAKEMIAALEEDATKPVIGPLALEMGPRIQKSLDGVTAAEKDLSASEEEAAYLHDMTIPALRAAWIEEYVKLHSAVVAVFHADPSRAESFFRPFRKERKKASATTGAPVVKGPTTTGGTPPAGGGAPPEKP